MCAPVAPAPPLPMRAVVLGLAPLALVIALVVPEAAGAGAAALGACCAIELAAREIPRFFRRACVRQRSAK